MRTMFDAVDARDVPATGWDLLAGYVNGAYQSYQPLKARFPTATVVSIDVLNHPGVAQVLDIETGDARPDEAPAWFDASVKAGITRPTLYYSASLHSAVKAAMGSRNYDYWIAAYGVSSCPVQGAVAWQKQDHGPNGENIDVSDVFDPYWPSGGLTMDAEVKAAFDAVNKRIDQIIDTLGTRPQGSGHIYEFVGKQKPDGKWYSAVDVHDDTVEPKLDQLLENTRPKTGT